MPQAALAALLLVFLRGQSAPPPSEPDFSIISRSPEAEIHFHGLALKSVRADDTQNEVALDFAAPIDSTAFDQLQEALPGWVAMAYSGYDNAVIRSARPVTFLTRPEADGFSLRMVPRDGAPAAHLQTAQLRGDVAERVPAAYAGTRMPHRSDAGWRPAREHYAVALAERPEDRALRRGYDLAQSRDPTLLRATGGWRESHDHSTLYQGHVETAMTVDGPIGVVARYDDTYAHANSVRRLYGGFTDLDRNSASGAIGIAYGYADGSQARAEVLYGEPGIGALLSVDIEHPFEQWGVSGAYHETYADTAEAVADDAVRDQAQIIGAGRIFGGLWASGSIRLTRYGVHGDASLAETAGFTAGLSYLYPLGDGATAGASYVADAEYTLAAHKYPGIAPTPFIPLSIRTREVHGMTGSLSVPVLDGVWLDAYGGYAVDRYGTQGALYGGALRWSVFRDFDIVLGGQHTQVADRQGETGPETSARLALTYR